MAKEQVDMLLLQESKLHTIDNSLCCQIWGVAQLDWKLLPAVNRAGGLLYIWRVLSLERVLVEVCLLAIFSLLPWCPAIAW